ncbi:hypothetical protein [Streptosporangium sp. NPDC087985]|uniref:hypothetical protein n=1 Tax=Streptosporangium sp. NPDC087985 TaxID=3366196 RepID=UPI003820D97C
MTSPDDLEAQLLALGEDLDIPAPPPAEVVRAVRARLDSLPAADRHPAPGPSTRRPGGLPRVPVRRASGEPGGPRPAVRLRRRAIVSAVAVLVALLLGGTPVGRAAVMEVLRFAGVELEIGGPGPLPSGLPEPLPGEHRVTLEQARRQVAFPISVPAVLGDPRDVRVSDGGRVVSLLWPEARLDEYDGRLQVVFRKELGMNWPEEVVLGTSPGWWIPARHGLSYLPRAGGGELPVRPRTAAPTLIWQRGQVGLRLEGAGDLQRALEIAGSAR